MELRPRRPDELLQLAAAGVELRRGRRLLHRLPLYPQDHHPGAVLRHRRTGLRLPDVGDAVPRRHSAAVARHHRRVHRPHVRGSEAAPRLPHRGSLRPVCPAGCGQAAGCGGNPE